MKTQSALKFKWTVSSVPTGRYRCFEKRGWPSATFGDQRPIICISCADAYVPKLVATGDHGELSVAIAFYTRPPDRDTDTFAWRTLSKRYATLKDAKAAAEGYVSTHPDFWPTEMQP